jgi:trehalose synthase
MSKGGADLSYDFITRPAYQHALLTGDTEFLRLMLRTVHEFGIDPASLIHALQNHDELTTELVHFWTVHANDIYSFQGTTWQGRTLRTHIRETIYERLSGPHARYNLRFVTNGISCTTTSIIAAAIGIEDLDQIQGDQVELITKIHLLLAMFNALQPGVFALSGWDLVGALPLRAEQVESLMQDGDTRWIGRGAYDLTGEASERLESNLGMPKAISLYGSIPEQLERPTSFASQLKKLLSVREAYGIANSRQTAIPDVSAAGLLVMVHELPDERGTQITALNFSNDVIDEVITLHNVRSGPVIDMISETDEGDLQENGELRIHLEPYEGLSLRVIGALPTL